MAGNDADLRRLAAVVEQQRRDIERLRASRAVDAVEAMARGVLMERLGLSAADSATQLANLAAATGMSPAEAAVAVLGPPVLASPSLGSALADGSASPGKATSARATSARATSARAASFGASAASEAEGRPSMAAAGPGTRDVLAEIAAERAADGAELAAAMADQVPAAASVALWLLEADGALALLGESGLGSLEASRWSRIPPQMDCPAQRVVRHGADLWWLNGQPEHDVSPVTGDPADARAVLALRERDGDLRGVLEARWVGPLAHDSVMGDVSYQTRERLASLAAGCARVIGAWRTHGDPAARPQAAVSALLDGVTESALVLAPIRDDNGQIIDFGIEYVGSGFCDPAGRADLGLTGLTLLAAYPGAVSWQGLFGLAARVLKDGVPQHVPGSLAATIAFGLVTDPEPAEGQVGYPDNAASLPADLRLARFFDRVIVTWRRGGGPGQLPGLLEDAQRLGKIGGWEENLVTGTVHWTETTFDLFGLAPGHAISLADLPSYVFAADRPAVTRYYRDLRQRRGGSGTFRIIHPEDKSIRQIRVFAEPVTDATGEVVALRGAFQDVSAHYHTQVALAATRDQLADSEQRVAEEHLLALRLQLAIMPPDAPPVEASGIDVAVKYRPAGEGHLVGGDWYDTLVLPSSEVLLVVGDIAGHGIDAVTGMVAARNSLRGLAITGAGPAELLAMLNGVMCHLTHSVIGTVVCGLYDPDTRVLRWARAGHLPPVMISEGKSSALPLPEGVLLGMDPDATYEEAIQALHPGDTLMFFTDGLIERRDVSIEDALGEFVALAGSDPRADQATAAQMATRMLRNAVSDTDDDACLVTVRVSAPEPGRTGPGRSAPPRH